MSDYVFEADLAAARTPPGNWYYEPQRLRLEQRRIFARTWQLVGREERLAVPGDYLTTEVAGEPLIVARGEDGRLRAFSNVCRHRAGPVAQGCGHGRTLQCRYHGWTYALDGRLLATPEFEGVAGFARDAHGLPPVRVASWAGFVFLNLDPGAAALDDVLGAILDETRGLELEQMRLYRTFDYELACNWKVYVDNYLEGYHIPIVHPGLFRQLDYGAYRVETARFHSKQYAPLRRDASDSLYRRHLPPGEEPLALYYWVFPNLMLNVYPDNVQVNLIVPLGPERTVTRFEWYVRDPGRAGLAEEFARSFAFSDEVQREDIAVCEAVQRGLRSDTYTCGRYSVRRENGLHHFHGLLCEFLA